MSIAEKLQTVAENEQKVYDAGKQVKLDELWEALQQGGTRTVYNHAFNGSFIPLTLNLFKPKYAFAPTQAEQMFRGLFSGENVEPVDFAALLEECGVSLDTVNSNTVNYMFDSANISRVGEINCVKAVNTNYLFNNSKIDTVDKLIVAENTTFIKTFTDGNLKNITIEGTIGNDVSFQACSLLTTGAEGETTNSVQSIIEALLTIEDGVARTITFHKTVYDKLALNGKLEQITNKNWEVGYV